MQFHYSKVLVRLCGNTDANRYGELPNGRLFQELHFSYQQAFIDEFFPASPVSPRATNH